MDGIGEPRPLSAAITALRAALKERARTQKALDKALAALSAAEAGQDLPALVRLLPALDPASFATLGLSEAGEALAQDAQALATALGQSQRRELTRGLRAACEAASRDFRMLTENPPEYRVGGFTVRVEPATMEAELLFCRLEVATSAARPEAILAAVSRAERELQAGQESPEDLFARLLRAYGAALGSAGLRPGERIELVDLLPHAALTYQNAKFLQNPQAKHYRPYTRMRFVYELGRLRAARLLEQGGLRLDLGTATGDSVKNKVRVFYLEDADGQGQYYLTLRFIPVQARL